MFPTASVSQVQQSIPKALQKALLGYLYILSHNNKKAFLGNELFIEFVEKEGILEQYEDWKIYNSQEVQKSFKEGHEIIESGDYSKTLSFEEICQK